MGRPKKGSLSSFSALLRQQIDKYRPNDIGKTGWSAKTISVELNFDTILKGESKPSISSIDKYLSKRGKLKRHNRHSELPSNTPIKAIYAHQLWQMDSEGVKKFAHVDWVAFINVRDISDKIYVMSYPCHLKTSSNHPKTSDYQAALRLSFMEWGMPLHLQTDHESAFFDNKTKSPFPTKLHLWLIGLNIELHFTPSGKPQKQGSVEKAHQTMHRQISCGRCFETEKELFDFTQQRRRRLNEDIPSTVTQNLPPLVAHPDARFSGRMYGLKEEKGIFDFVLVHNYLANGRWFRRVAANKTISIGGYLYHLTKAKPKWDLEIRFNRDLDGFDCFNADGLLIEHVQTQGLTFKELSGNLSEFIEWCKINNL